MAKKKIESELPKGSLFDLLKKVDDSVEILSESVHSKIPEWIPSGNYMLNACMSGDLFKALPCGRITILAGASQSGKSYLQASFCREGQKMGYTPVIIDTESSIDSDFVSRLGCDPNRIIIKQAQTITEVTQFIGNLCKQLDEQEATYGTHDKVMIVVDSLSQLTSDKERDDSLAGNNKRDMTKQQEMKAMFRVITTPMGRLGIPMIGVAHVYSQIGAYVPTNVISGGSGIMYSGSITLELSVKKLEDKQNDNAAAKNNAAGSQTKNGVLVTAKPIKTRFCKPLKVSFGIPYYKAPNPYFGLEAYLTWENAGVGRGNCLTAKEYEKLTPGDKAKALPFDYNGETLYFLPKDTARGMVIKHLGKQVSFVDFYSDTVFTQEFLEYININVIHPIFKLPEQDSFDDIKDVEESLGISED